MSILRIEYAEGLSPAGYHSNYNMEVAVLEFSWSDGKQPGYPVK